MTGIVVRVKCAVGGVEKMNTGCGAVVFFKLSPFFWPV
jgi:hypothetical protein